MKHSYRTTVLVTTAALLIVILAACGGANAPTIATTAPEETATAISQPTATPLSEPSEPVATAEPASTATPKPAAEAATEAAPQATPAEAASPVETLLAEFPGESQAKGTVVLLFGRVLDVNGNPVSGAAVEIWQTDAQGIYDHPGDSDTASRDRSFQFYGTSVTGDDGVYVFRTIEPGYYEPRPKHIHVKVKIDGQEALTTQFYFEEDRADLASEGVFSQAGSQGDLLILKAVADAAGDAAGVRILSSDLVIDTGIGSGTLTLTPAQTEGPYYPVMNVAEFDNDLTIVP